MRVFFCDNRICRKKKIEKIAVAKNGARSFCPVFLEHPGMTQLEV
jgi:hypothetical protein